MDVFVQHLLGHKAVLVATKGANVSAHVGPLQGYDSLLSHLLLLAKNVKITQPLGLLHEI